MGASDADRSRQHGENRRHARIYAELPIPARHNRFGICLNYRRMHDVSPPTRSLLSYGSLSEIVGASARVVEIDDKSRTPILHTWNRGGILPRQPVDARSWGSPIRFHIGIGSSRGLQIRFAGSFSV